MQNPKLVVVAPGFFAPSGGPEALHQLVYMANIVQPGSAAILYEPAETIESSIAPYRKYNCPTILEQDIPHDALIVLPEIWPELSSRFKNKCALWWLSVGFFGSHGHSDISGIDIHLTQSFYAKEHLKTIGINNSQMLTDWIDLVPVLDFVKENLIAVNPAKGIDLINSFSKNNPDLNIIKIQGMNKQEVTTAMSKSKIYIDFGHHPGRDRMPREASLLNAVVFVKRTGAASYKEDVPIDEYFKFDDISELREKIIYTLDNYEAQKDIQEEYKSWCLNNYKEFMKETSSLLSGI